MHCHILRLAKHPRDDTECLTGYYRAANRLTSPARGAVARRSDHSGGGLDEPGYNMVGTAQQPDEIAMIQAAEELLGVL